MPRRTLVFVLVVGCGGAPEAPGVRIEPAEPRTTDALFAVVEGGDPHARTEVRWFRDGERAEGFGGDAVPAGTARAGETWRVEVVAVEGRRESAVAADEVRILGTSPTLSVAVVPTDPAAGEPLLARVEVADADGDAVAVGFAWTADGRDAGLGADTVPAGTTARCERWTVEVTASDGSTTETTASAAITVGNQLPRVGSVILAPQPLTAATPPFATATATDDDGDPVTVRLDWLVDGVVVQSGAETLLATPVARGQVVQVVAVPDDGCAPGLAVPSAPLVVADAPPTVASASVVPAVLDAATVATCAGAGWSDADGDLEDYRVRWRVGGVQTLESPTFSGFVRGDQVECELVPWDGLVEGAPVRSAPVLVGNALPVIGSVTLTHPTPRERDVVGVVVDGEDPDGDAIIATIRWLVNGAARSASPVLTGASFDRGDTLVAEVRWADGAGETVAASAPVTVVDTAPVLIGAWMTPAAPGTDDPVTVGFAARDDDGDPVTLDIAWTVDGVATGPGPVLDPALSARGQALGATVTPSDGTLSGPPYAVPPVAVVNSPPGAPVVDPVPGAVASAGASIGCDVAVGSVDPDGDPVTYTWTWTLDGEPTPHTTATVPAEDVVGGAWTCVVTPSDPTATGGAAEVAIVVRGLLGDQGLASADATYGDHWGSPAVISDLDGDGRPEWAVPDRFADPNGLSSGDIHVFAGAPTGALGPADAWLVLQGHAADVLLGGPVARGDVDDDGVEELVLASDALDGAVYVLDPPLGPGIATTASSWARLRGTGGNGAGASVAVGDATGDGRVDLLIGAPNDDRFAVASYDHGAAYLVEGPIGPGIQGLDATASTLFLGEDLGAFRGPDFGLYVLLWDFDGDGAGEPAITGPYDDYAQDGGTIYVWDDPYPATATMSDATFSITGEERDDRLRASTSADLDGDGLEDLVASASSRTEVGSPSNAGTVYLIPGSVAGSSGSVSDLATWWIVGEGAEDSLTAAVAGDLDADGELDLAVGAAGNDGSGNDAGAVYVFLGPPGAGVSVASDAPVIRRGTTAGVDAGSGLAAGDIDGDGADDLIIDGDDLVWWVRGEP